MPAAAWPVSSALSDSFMRGAVPWPSRSSGTKATPSLRRSVIEARPTACASMMMLSAWRERRSPEIAENNSSWPLPETPAMSDDFAAVDIERNLVRAARPCGSSGSRVRSWTRRRQLLACVRLGAAPRRYRRRPSCAPAMPPSPGADRRSRPSCRRAGWSRCRTAAFTSSSLWEM